MAILRREDYDSLFPTGCSIALIHVCFTCCWFIITCWFQMSSPSLLPEPAGLGSSSSTKSRSLQNRPVLSLGRRCWQILVRRILFGTHFYYTYIYTYIIYIYIHIFYMVYYNTYYIINIILYLLYCSYIYIYYVYYKYTYLTIHHIICVYISAYLFHIHLYMIIYHIICIYIYILYIS